VEDCLVTILAMALLLAGGAQLPSYPEALRCAGYTQAQWETQTDKATPEARQFRKVAEFWSFAAMDAARVAGKTSAGAEADQVKARAEAHALLESDADAAGLILLACEKLMPASVV
jgi:hypothetical protein